MPRGSRRYVFAAIAGLILTAPPAQREEDQRAQTAEEAEASERTPPAAILTAQPIEIVEGAEENEPCKPGEDNRQSDLCAQWKAADASRDAADWTWWGLMVGITGTVGLFITLHYTRKAVRASEASAKEASKALAIAERNADAVAEQARATLSASYNEIRPWIRLNVTRFQVQRISTTEWNATIAVEIKNAGASPAIKLAVGTRSGFGAKPKNSRPDSQLTGPVQAPIFPGETSENYSIHLMDQETVAKVTRSCSDASIQPCVWFDVTVIYSSKAGNETHCSAFCYIMFGVNQEIDWMIKDIPVGGYISPLVSTRLHEFDVLT